MTTRRQTPWMPLNTEEFLVARGTTKHKGGVTTSETRSSYELPLSLRLFYDEETRLAGFEFRYAFEEEGREFSLDGAKLTLGRHSLRVIRIEVPVLDSEAQTPAGLVTAALPRAMQALEHYVEYPRRWRHAHDIQEDNFMVAKAAMNSEGLPRLAYAL